jgi:hypothetical protein
MQHNSCISKWRHLFAPIVLAAAVSLCLPELAGAQRVRAPTATAPHLLPEETLNKAFPPKRDTWPSKDLGEHTYSSDKLPLGSSEKLPFGRTPARKDTLGLDWAVKAPILSDAPKPADAWKSWADLPKTAPSGYLVPKQRAVGDLAPEKYPGIVFRAKQLSARGPPTSSQLRPPVSLEIESLSQLSQPTPPRLQQAVRALLRGPDGTIFAEYARSPEGRYILDVSSGTVFPSGRYEIQIIVDGNEKTIVRKIPIKVPSEVGEGADPSQLKVYVTKEKIDGSDASPRTTFETDAQGEKLLRSGIEDMDAAVLHYQEQYKALNAESSYQLKWNTTFGYAKALHDAALWHRYDYLADAKRMFKMVQAEFEASKSRWFFSRWFFRELTDIGIKEIDFIEHLRDLEALELQMVYTKYALSGNDMAIKTLPASLLEFQQRYQLDKEALYKRLKVDDQKLSAGVAQVQTAVSKLEKPVLKELDDGNFVVIDIDHRD